MAWKFIPLAIALAQFATSQVAAQTLGAQPIRGDASYSYAVFIGTGLYELDDRRIFVFRIPGSLQLRELNPDQMGIKLLLPVAIGIQISTISMIFSDSSSTIFRRSVLFPG